MISVTTYLVLHLSAIFVLLGYTFYAFAAPLETKRRVMMVTGIAALVILITGMGMMARLHLAFQGWLAVKIVCWLALAAMGSFAYRRRAQADLFMMITFLLAITAVAMVYYRPF
jgi:hypothetical protein